jgi:glycine cleavage system H protein
MKELSELSFPENLRYAESHEWLNPDGSPLKIGISDYAQDQLGDVVYVELPEVGQTLAKGAPFGSVESVKAVSELYLPVGGKVVEKNAALADSPELVNKAPYGEGWMIAIEPADPQEIDQLLTRQAYHDKLKG